jgi:hypothetical protein
MKIAKAVATALLATTALSGVTAAFASSDPAATQSDLFVAIWNPSTNVSVVQDLGASFSSINSLTSQSWAIDGGNAATALGAGTYQFALFAEDQVTGRPDLSYFGQSAYFSQKSGTALPTLVNSDMIDTGMAANLTPYVEHNLPGATTTFVSTGATNYWASTTNPGSTFGISGFPAGTSVANALELVHWVAGGTQADDDGTANAVGTVLGNSSGAGLFTFAGSTLTYTLGSVVAQTPLPAAAWLLISGLLGLGAVGRRRDGSKAAAA